MVRPSRDRSTGTVLSRPAGTTRLIRWVAVIATTAVAGLLGDRIGVPSAAMFAGLVVGLVVALRTSWALDVPAVGMRLSQAVLGTSLGLLIVPSTLRELGSNAGPIALVIGLTLVLTLAAGLAMHRLTGLDRPTAMFGMIAGGASGIVAISRDLGADERQVAVMQYLRILVIVVLAPVVAGVVSTGEAAASASPSGDGWAHGLLTLVLCVAVGATLGRLARVTAGSLLGPLVVAAALSIAGVPFVAEVPAPLLQAAYLAIGLTVGLRFTLASLRYAARILPMTLAMIGFLIVGSAAIGMLLVPLAGVGALDAYLATTPGGLYAVLAAAASSDVDATLVLTVQVLRLFAVLLIAPLVGRWLAHSS